MSDLESYENSLEKFTKIVAGTSMPLHSWDFYSTHFDSLKVALSDAHKLQNFAQINRWIGHWNFYEALKEKRTIVLTDPQLKIVFASENILEMSGFTSDEVVGNSPRMFQGEGTSRKDLDEIRTLVQLQKPFEKTILNYKKNGETYQCQIQGFPIFNSKRELVNFVAFETAA